MARFNDYELEGGSALRFDEGQQDDYCLPVPSHPPESDRLDALHEVYRYSCGNLPDEAAALLSDGTQRRVLDIGCGTGKWACEMAQAHPDVLVVGQDLVHPPIPHLPSNFIFEIHDVTKGQDYPDETFDVVNIRDIHAGMPDYQGMLHECVRILRPGGYLIVKEIEWDPRLSDPEQEPRELYPWFCDDLWRRALAERGLDPWAGVNLPHYIGNLHGLANIEYTRHPIPMKPWSDEELQSFTGSMTRVALSILGNTMRVMLIDHGAPDPDTLYLHAQRELAEVDGEPVWYFGNVVARKAGVDGGGEGEGWESGEE
ncbi:hypothetical protein IAT38_008080 [Cryptococcus sp. DSM 104549]